MSDPIQEIKEKLDIVDVIKEYIPLMPAGKSFKAPCPFHKERTPSFIVSPDRQTWHCFGSCNEGGDVFSFIMKYEHVEFYEALQMLAQKAGIELNRVSPSSQKEFGVLYDISVAAKDFFVSQLSQESKASDYLSQRGLKKETIEEFEIGFAPTGFDALMLSLLNAGYNIADAERAGLVFKTDRGTYMDRFRGRVMFPIYNTFGKVVGFSGRILPELDDGKMGKYVNSPETPIFNKSRILYGLAQTKQHIRDSRVAMLVEGQMDFLMLYQDGVHNVVATSGTALTQHHLDILRKIADRLVLAFDSDDAGMIAIERAIDMAHTIDLTVNIFLLKDAKDAAEYIQKNPGQIKRLIESSAMSALDFYFKRYLENVPEYEIKNKIRHILEKVVLIYSPIEQSRWLKKIAEKAGVPESALTDELNLIKKKSYRKQDSQNLAPIPNQEVPLKTRLEKISMELLILGSMDASSLTAINDAKTFLPDKFIVALDFIQGVTTTDQEATAIAQYADMKSSLRFGEVDLAKVPLEINVLIKELKKEFYTERKQNLLLRMKSLERGGQLEEAQNLLKEFDEITKLVNN
jgi:DNA primase